MTLQALIGRSWEVQDFQVSGPDWIAYSRWDVLAKLPPGTHRAGQNPMLQHLLEERFGLVVHHMHKEISGYGLVAGKGGAKFKESPLTSGGSTGTHTGKGVIEATGITMKELASDFAKALGRPVVDQTNLDGKFDLTLKWAPEDQAPDSDAV